MSDNGLLARIGALIRTTRPQVSPAWKEPLAELTRRLARPLQLVVAGEVSAGKSAVINALLGRRIAPVQLDETAHVLTVYRRAARHAEPHACLVTTAGRHRVEFEPGGELPLLPADAPGALRIEVELAAGLLDNVDLVDTPGLYSGNPAAGHSERGRRALLGDADRPGLAAGEAVLFVLGKLADEKVAVTLAELRGSAVLVAFNKADAPQDDADPFLVTRELVGQTRRQLGPLVTEVVPVSAKMAGAALPGALDAGLLDLLAGLGRGGSALTAMNAPALRRADIPAAEAARLLRILGPYGIGWVAARLARDPDTRTLPRDLRRRSGLPVLVEAIRRLAAAAPLLKAAAALSELNRLAATPAGAAPAVRSTLAAGVHRLSRHPSLHRLAERRVLDRLAGAPDGLGTESRRRLRLLLSAPTPAERLGAVPGLPRAGLHDLAVAERRRWMVVASREQALNPDERQAVATALRTLTLLSRDTYLDEGEM